MKKLTRKLFLSVAALAVCAATLVSTTFAWYVSNTSASVGGLNGATAGTEVGGNLLVALNKVVEDVDTPDNFTSNITLTASTVKLDPITKATAADADNNIAVGDWVDHKGAKVADAPVIEYKFWIMSTEVTSIKVEATLENTTETLIAQTVYSATSLPTAAGTGAGTAATAPTKIGDTFTADAVNALACEIIEQDQDEEAKTPVTGALTGLMSTYASPATMVTGGDANQYYKAVLGEVPYATTAGTGASTLNATGVTWNSLTLTKGVARLITIRIWLEGADADCWDSCRGQTFTLDLKFSTDAE